MKTKSLRSRAALALIPVVASLFIATPPANAAGVVPDAALAGCINSTLKRDAGTSIQVSDLTSITTLTCEQLGIQDLTGMEYLTNLEKVYLSENGFVDVSPLARLTKLTRADLASNTIVDVSPLAGLTSLEYLALASNVVKDPSPLANLSALTYLSLNHNQITDLSSLNNKLPNITRFTANGQWAFLPEATVGEPFSFVVKDVMGTDVPVTLGIPDQGSYDLAAGTVTYTQGEFNQLQWSTTVTVGNVTTTFSGEFDQNINDAVTPPAPPAPVDDAASVEQDTSVTINVLDNDGDTTGWTVTATSTPVNGTVIINNDGTVTYTPNEGFTGDDSFTYTVANADGSTATATVTVTVTEADTSVDPVDPTDPTDPTDPVDPVDPADPVEPTDTNGSNPAPGPAATGAPATNAAPLATTGAETTLTTLAIAGILSAAGILIGTRRRRAQAS